MASNTLCKIKALVLIYDLAIKKEPGMQDKRHPVTSKTWLQGKNLA